MIGISNQRNLDLQRWSYLLLRHSGNLWRVWEWKGSLWIPSPAVFPHIAEHMTAKDPQK